MIDQAARSAKAGGERSTHRARAPAEGGHQVRVRVRVRAVVRVRYLSASRAKLSTYFEFSDFLPEVGSVEPHG